MKAILPAWINIDAWGSASFAAPAGERGDSDGLQEILFLARRPREQEAVVALARPAIYGVSIVLGFVDMATGNYNPEAGIGLFSGIFGLLSLTPAIIVNIKRFHDRDKSGWWVLIVLIPIIGAIWLLIELGFLKGTPGPNQFGSPVTD
jgi:uncharacterized membrane protein YhaH (DUF805 family)